VLEFSQIPFGDFGNDIVEGWFEASGGGFCDGVGQFGQGVTESNFSGSVGKRVSRSFGSKGTDISAFSTVERTWIARDGRSFQ